MLRLTTTLAAAAVATTQYFGGAEPAQAQSIVDRLGGANVTHCVDIETQDAEELVALRVHYKTDACRINGDHIAAIQAAIAQAQANNPGEPLYAFVVGETDPRASDAYNQRLGQQRASGLQRALEQRGVTVIKSLSIGESRTPQEIRDNPDSRNAYAVIGDAATVQACLAAQQCPVTRTVRSALRMP